MWTTIQKIPRFFLSLNLNGQCCHDISLNTIGKSNYTQVSRKIFLNPTIGNQSYGVNIAMNAKTTVSRVRRE